MITSRIIAPLPLLIIGLVALAAVLLIIPWSVQAQTPEVTPTAGATGDNPPAKPMNLQASAEHDSVDPPGRPQRTRRSPTTRSCAATGTPTQRASST